MSETPPNRKQSPRNSHRDDEIDLREIFTMLWRGKVLISAVTALSAALSIAFALSLPDIYRANALLAPAESSGGGLSGLMQQYGGLASLAGVQLPGDEEVSRAQLGIQLMKSRAFIGDFVERRDILPALLAVEEWDSDSGQLIFDPEIYDVESQTWMLEGTPTQSYRPSPLAAHKAFINILGVSKSNQTGFVSVSIDHQSPVVAARWVNWLIEDVNVAVRLQDVEEAEKSIDYLKQQVVNTPLADLQAMFFELIQSQTETVMLAEVRPEYVFKTIDPAVAPEERAEPNRALICVLGTLIGGIFGVVIIVVQNFTRSSSDG